MYSHFIAEQTVHRNKAENQWTVKVSINLFDT